MSIYKNLGVVQTHRLELSQRMDIFIVQRMRRKDYEVGQVLHGAADLVQRAVVYVFKEQLGLSQRLDLQLFIGLNDY